MTTTDLLFMTFGAIVTLGFMGCHLNAKAAYLRGWHDGWESLRKEFREFDQEQRRLKALEITKATSIGGDRGDYQ